jgi:hypothetical protein
MLVPLLLQSLAVVYAQILSTNMTVGCQNCPKCYGPGLNQDLVICGATSYYCCQLGLCTPGYTVVFPFGLGGICSSTCASITSGMLRRCKQPE